MYKVSYISQCKGRLWQLKQVFHINLVALKSIDAEWLILDFNSPDGLIEWIKSQHDAQSFLKSGQLKIFELTKEFQYSIPLAKNLAHSLASGQVVFNLDIDNQIADSYALAKDIDSRSALVCENKPRTGRYGRIALTKENFIWLGGYDLELFGAGFHDVNLVERLKFLSFIIIQDDNAPLSIPNTSVDTSYYLPKSGRFDYYNQFNMKLAHEKLVKNIVRVNQQGLTLCNDIDLIGYVTKHL